RAEDRVDPPELRERFVDAAVAVAHLDRDRHAHDVLGPAHRYWPACVRALASDCAYARLVYVAPDTMSTRADCAWIASERRIGAEYWLIRADRERSRGSWSASTSRSLPPDTAISTWTGPNCVSTVAPVNGVPPAAAM